jgi:hypothetical protein
MNKLILFLMVSVLFIAGCLSNSQTTGNATANNLSAINKGNATFDTRPVVNIEKLEIYHFHGTNQCYSCKTVGAYAEETVNTYFADELKSGKITFAHINGELPENRELVAKYGVTGASLWLGTYTKDGNFSAEQNTNVWYKIDNKTEYMSYLKGIIEQKLTGN